MTALGAELAPARRPSAAQRRAPAIAGEVSLALALPVATVLGLHTLRSADERNIGSLGLVQALPVGFWAAIVLLTVGFLGTVFLARAARPLVLSGYVAAFVVLLHGAASVVESLPRFVPAWLHAGFVDYIARTGQSAPDLDARFSWPGFFALWAMGTRAAGLPDAMPLLDWMPVAVNLFSVAVVYRLARLSFPESRAPWLAAWLSVPANWVGQDYFSPQALNYQFYLLVCVALLLWFRTSHLERLRHRRHRPRRAWRHWMMRGAGAGLLRHEPEPVPGDGRTLAGVMVAVVLLFTASTMSHQLTPVAMIVAVAALVVVRRCSVRALPWLLTVIFAAYVSYLASAFWAGHLDNLIREIGQVGQNVNSGIQERVQGDPGHLFVTQVRQWVAVAVWGLAALGAWRWLRRGRGDLSLIVLALAPFLLLLAQSYGGEILLRIYLFALPFVVVLVVALFVPAGRPRRAVLTGLLVCVLSLGLTGAFFVARYGNENFERVRPADAAAVEWLYDRARPGTTFVALTYNVNWRSKAVEGHKYTPLADQGGPGTVREIETLMQDNPLGAYLIITEGQYVMAESFLGQPAGWGEAIERRVSTSDRFRLVYSQAGAKIFVLAGPEGGGL